MAHAMTESRNGLVIGGRVTITSGAAAREAALALIDRHRAAAAGLRSASTRPMT